MPDDFRFSVKVPKAITHERHLIDCADIVKRFAGEIAGLGAKLGPLLVQLPPRFAFPGKPAWAFFDLLRQATGAALVCEPRHASWFTERVETAFTERGIARVAADPPPVRGAEKTGGWQGLVYWRLHGSPEIYRSNYAAGEIRAQARLMKAVGEDVEAWTIFDNTTFGAATSNALALSKQVFPNRS